MFNCYFCKEIRFLAIQWKDQQNIMVYGLYNFTYEEVKIKDSNMEQVISKEAYERFELHNISE